MTLTVNRVLLRPGSEQWRLVLDDGHQIQPIGRLSLGSAQTALMRTVLQQGCAAVRIRYQEQVRARMAR
jgi:hypothetical protein